MATFLQQHWLAVVMPFVGMLLILLRRWRLVGMACILIGIGGLALPGGAWGLGMLLACGSLLLAMLFVVVLSGKWSAPLGYFAAAVLLLGLGAWGLESAAGFFTESGRVLLSLGVDEPWWLLGLLLLPVMVGYSYERLAALGATRRWLALALRCLLVVFICLALAETHARQLDHDVTVLFVIDRSLSIPSEFENGKDVRQERILNFINQAVQRRGSGREGDRTGVIVFGRFPRLEFPPAKVDQLPIKKLQSVIDENYTDISAALKLALASFPEGTSKRIVLISDGNENLGNAVEQARIAKHNGVRIDSVAIAAGRRSPNEVMVERVEAPTISATGSKIPLKVVLRSFYPGVVVGDLSLIRHNMEKQKNDEGKDEFVFPPQTVLVTPIKLQPGLTVRFFQQPSLRPDEAVTYEAKFDPRHVETPDGRIVKGLPGDRIENNRASTTVISRGQRAILLVESVAADSKEAEVRTGNHRLLIERLQQGGGLNVVPLRSDILPKEPDRLAMILSKFDCVILANVAADELTDVQQSVLRSNTHEQGAGLIMIGGPLGFGAGGWQDTELEKALPVTCDNKSTKIDVPGGLVLAMHASEMADGNAWQKKVAKLAIEKLTPIDMIGMTYFGGIRGGHNWHIPFQSVGDSRSRLFRFVDEMIPGDMPDFETPLTMARAELNKPEYNLGTKHIIFISDGDTTFPTDATLRKVGSEGITLTTVCITSHGAGEVARMREVVDKVVTPTGKKGRHYHVKDPSKLPAIYVKETRMVSQSYVYQKLFDPMLVRRDGPVGNLKSLPPLHGFVRTSRRPTNLVEVPIITPRIGEDDFPVLAYWNYGLGRSVAFTSDARSNEAAQYWDREWAGSKNSSMYTQFWQQLVDWVRRKDSDEKQRFLSVTTDQRNGKVRVIVEALHPDPKINTPLTTIKLEAGVTALSFQQREARKVDLKFEQKSAGIYEAEIQADEVGSYLLNIKGTWPEGNMTDNVRAGVTIPYSPEFSEMESRPELLRKLADMTGGKVYEENDDVLGQTAASGELYYPVITHQRTLQPLWWLLVILTGVGMFFDVAVRRISIEPAVVVMKMQNLWASLRGREGVAAAIDPFIERLKSRKAQVDDTLAKEKGTRRFDGVAGAPPPPGAMDGPAPPKEQAPKPSPAPGVAPEKETEAADFASRLMRAKKRAQEERDKK